MVNNEKRWRSGVLLAVLLQSLTNIGCYNSSSFSGHFSVLNSSDTTIVVTAWEGFDVAQPLHGTFAPGSQKNAIYGWQDKIPKTVVVKWVDEGDEALKRQEIDLTDVVPASVKGSTQFELSKDGKWSASFVKTVEVNYR